MVDGNNKFETRPKYGVEARTDRNILSNSLYTSNGTIIGNKTNNVVEGTGIIYATKGTGDHSNTYIAGSTKAKVKEVMRDNNGVEESEVSSRVKSLGTDYGFKAIGATKGVERSASRRVEETGASYDVKGTKFGFDVPNTRANSGNSRTKAWTNIKENIDSDVDDDDIEFNVSGGKTRTSVRKLEASYETSSPSFQQNKPHVEKTNKENFFDRIFAVSRQNDSIISKIMHFQCTIYLH